MSKSTKLNKTQTADLVATIVAQTLAENTDLFKKDKAPILEDLLISNLKGAIGPKTGGGTSTKVNEDGKVYCNYFEQYRDPTDFNKKQNKAKDGYVYKANSILAEQIIRKVKNLKKKLQDQQVTALMEKHITAEEMQANIDLGDADWNKTFYFIDDVPSVAEVLGLTEAKEA